MNSEEVEEELLTPQQLAKRLHMTLAAVYRRLGCCNESDGVLRISTRMTRIDWDTFYQRLRSRESHFLSPGERKREV
jgi:hypothetical protein